MSRMVDAFQVVSLDVTFDPGGNGYEGVLSAPKGTIAISAGVNGTPGGVYWFYPEEDLSAWNFKLNDSTGTATLYIVCVS